MAVGFFYNKCLMQPASITSDLHKLFESSEDTAIDRMFMNNQAFSYAEVRAILAKMGSTEASTGKQDMWQMPPLMPMGGMMMPQGLPQQ